MKKRVLLSAKEVLTLFQDNRTPHELKVGILEAAALMKGREHKEAQEYFNFLIGLARDPEKEYSERALELICGQIIPEEAYDDHMQGNIIEMFAKRTFFDKVPEEENVHGFLDNTFASNHDFVVCKEETIILAMIHTRAWKPLRRHALTGAIPQIYKNIRKARPDTPRLSFADWDSLPTSIDTHDRTRLEPRLASKLKRSRAFKRDVATILRACGNLLLNSGINEEAETLASLVAILIAAVTN